MMRAALAVAAALLVGGCGHNFDVEKVLKITDVHTGWYDAGIQDGKNKLVPSISLKLENTSDEQVESVQVNAIFRQMGDTQAWGEHFATAIDRDGLPAHRTTPGYLVLRSNLGYTGPSRACRCCRTATSSTPRLKSTASTARAPGRSSASTRSIVNC